MYLEKNLLTKLRSCGAWFCSGWDFWLKDHSSQHRGTHHISQNIPDNDTRSKYQRKQVTSQEQRQNQKLFLSFGKENPGSKENGPTVKGGEEKQGQERKVGL